MKPVRLYRWFFFVLAACLLTACGFHLRTQQPLPFKTIYIDAPKNSDETRKMMQRLIKGMHLATVVSSSKEAEVVFSIISEQRNKQVLSYNSDGRAREYSLFLKTSYVIRTGRGQVLVEPTTLTLQRAMTFDDSEALAKENEEILLYKEMRTDLVQQMLRRLSALKISADIEEKLTAVEDLPSDNTPTNDVNVDEQTLVPVDLDTAP